LARLNYFRACQQHHRKRQLALLPSIIPGKSYMLVILVYVVADFVLTSHFVKVDNLALFEAAKGNPVAWVRGKCVMQVWRSNAGKGRIAGHANADRRTVGRDSAVTMYA